MKADLAQKFARLSPVKQALLVQELQSRLEALERLQVEPIAIIGISCRFPGGARDPQSFWTFLREGGDAITEVPPDRWDWRAFCDPGPVTPGKINTRWGGFIQQLADFDATAFGISPREAERMDPQQRLLLEAAWEALEDAGLMIERLRGTRTGVFIGCSAGDYARLQLSDPFQIDALVGVGNIVSMAASRISYWFDFRGPSMVIDTACSSSLVAIHLACQSLRTGESTIALAGGVNAILLPETHIIFSKAGLIAPDGACKVFDERADGYARGEGVGLLALKPLSQALADADSIYAVIRGSAVNQDGRSNGITAPNRQAQEAVLQDAYRNAGILPGEIQYVEAHGTGTALGDLIEAQALGSVLSSGRPPEQACLIGSVKSNIGHLETAAGVASVIKVALALKHKELPASLHFRDPNPQIPFDELPLRVAQRLEPWPQRATPALAGVSSFSFGGTNAHLVLEEAPPIEPSGRSRPWQVLMLSAKTDSALESATSNLISHLKQNPDGCFADLAYTLQTGRSPFGHRRMAVCRSATEAASVLEKLDRSEVFTAVCNASDRPLIFLFPGLGEQYVNMAHGLYQDEPTFRSVVDHCCELLVAEFDLDLRRVIFDQEKSSQDETQRPGLNLRKMLRRGGDETSAASERLNQTYMAQPAVFVVEYALARLLQSWGVQPQAMIGHSLGEYVAACLAGVFSLEDGLRLVTRRARLIEEIPRGGMLAVALGEEGVQPYLGRGLSLAAINGPQFCVLAGTESEVDKAAQQLSAREVAVSRLPTRHAFHSEMMKEIAAPFRALLRETRMRAPQIPYISNVTGKWIEDDEATSVEYWVNHLCQTVRFGEGVEKLLSGAEQLMIEVGPGQSLSAFVKLHPMCRTEQAPLIFASMRSESERESDERYLMRLLGKLWLAGGELDWAAFYERERRHRVRLPTYPFERRRHWSEPTKTSEANAVRQSPLRRRPDMADWFYRPVWMLSTLPAPAVQPADATEDASWLIFLDTCGVGAGLSKRLREQRHKVVTVSIGEKFVKLSDWEYIINPRQREHYSALIKELHDSGYTPNEVAHLWNVSPDRNREVDHGLFAAHQELGFYSMIFLAQAFKEQYPKHPIQITVVSSNLHRVTGQEPFCPEKATLLGPCKIIPQEYSNIRCRNIDVSFPAVETLQSDYLVNQLLAECRAKTSDVVIAYRGRKRWAQEVEPFAVETTADSPSKLRDGGVYLITGGLGAIGLELAEYLAQAVRAKLTLIGRSAFPDREEWDEWLINHGDEDEISRKIQKLKALQDLGAEILVISADVANEPQMRDVMNRVSKRFGPLNGVIHAAGIVSLDAFRMIHKIGRDDCECHFHPKVHGSLVIEKLLRGKKLDFCLVLSSLSPILGGVGLVAYAAANCFLDSFAVQQTNEGRTPWTGVNLEHWQTTEPNRDGSMGLGSSLAEFGISPKEGVAVFRRIFSVEPGTQIIISSGDLQARINKWVRLESLSATKEAEKAKSPTPAHHRRVLGTTYVEARNEMERRIEKIWKESLGVEQVGVEDGFFELGGHSLLAVQVFAQLRSEFQVDIPMRNLFEMTTIASQAELISTVQWIGQDTAPNSSNGAAAADLVEGEL